MAETITTLEGALDGASLAAFLLDSRGRVCRMSHAAENMVGNALILRLHDRRLSAQNPVDSLRLSRAIDAATGQKMRVDNQPNSTPRIALRDATGCVAAVASVRPLMCGSQDFVANSPTAAVFVDLLIPSDDAVLRTALSEAFDLTPAEANLAVSLYTTGDLTLAAARVNIATGSARTRLKTVFQKTGTNGQVGLTKLVSELRMVSK